MSTFAELIKEPFSKKIYVAEIDITKLLSFAVNWRAFCYLVNLDVDYPDDPEIDPVFLDGVGAIVITQIGSMKSDGTLLQQVDGASDVQENELSFHWDSMNKDLYFHLLDGAEPEMRRLTIGEIFGVANFACDYGGFIYESRLLSFPGINRQKDPLFFGKIVFESGRLEWDNRDGFFDTFCEDRNVVNAVCRVKQGFSGLDFTDFMQTSSGVAEKFSVGSETFTVDFKDRRASLDKKIPDAIFEQTTYPNLKDRNIGKSVPIAYGILRNVPVTCTNEEEAPPPTDYSFKLCDTTHHGIKEITEVRVKGIVKTPSSTNLVNATFELAVVDYSPGDEVRVDFQGYVDEDNNLIKNPLDIIRDMLVTYYPMNYNNQYFDVDEWEIAKLESSDIHYYSKKPEKIIDIIEEACNSTFLLFIPLPDDLYTARYYDENAPILQTIPREEVLETPTIEYDSTQMLRYIRVGYDRDWAEDDFKYYLHDSEDERTDRDETFETLLTTEADALIFAKTVMLLSGDLYKPFNIKIKLQALEREIMDFISVEVMRRSKKMLGWVKAEILSITQDPNVASLTLGCRILEILPEILYTRSYYGDTYYGDNYYG